MKARALGLLLAAAGILLSADSAVPLKKPGLPNFFRVSAGLYRGGMPGPGGIDELVKLGVRTVVCLQTTDDDRRAAEARGLLYIHIPMIAFFPSEQRFRRFLRVVGDPAQRPVFVHCRHGSDRTGAAVALYRIYLEGWPVDRAIEEMTRGPFGFHPIHTHLVRFVRGFHRQ